MLMITIKAWRGVKGKSANRNGAKRIVLRMRDLTLFAWSPPFYSFPVDGSAASISIKRLKAESTNNLILRKFICLFNNNYDRMVMMII